MLVDVAAEKIAITLTTVDPDTHPCSHEVMENSIGLDGTLSGMRASGPRSSNCIAVVVWRRRRHDRRVGSRFTVWVPALIL